MKLVLNSCIEAAFCFHFFHTCLHREPDESSAHMPAHPNICTSMHLLCHSWVRQKSEEKGDGSWAWPCHRNHSMSPSTLPLPNIDTGLRMWHGFPKENKSGWNKPFSWLPELEKSGEMRCDYLNHSSAPGLDWRWFHRLHLTKPKAEVRYKQTSFYYFRKKKANSLLV